MTSENRALRVLYVINGLGTGGAERSLIELIEPLSVRQVEVKIAYLIERSEGVASEGLANVETFQVGPRLVPALPRLGRLLRRLEPDLLHTTIFEADLIGRLASIGSGVKVVTSLVNTSYSRAGASNPDVSNTKLALARMIDGFTARHINAGFHALTEAAKRENAADLRLDPASIEVVPRGRSTARLGKPSIERRLATRGRLGLADDQPVLLSVGRREHQKGQVHAVEAMGVIRTTHPSARLLIAGRDGAASARLEAVTEKLGLDDHVVFLGHRPDVADIMVASDVLVFPSLYEGFGGTLVEAMALGLPIVASDIPVMREVVAETGLLVERGSAPELAEAVRLVLDDATTARRLREAGIARYESRYRLDVVADEMRDMYLKFVDGDSA